MTGEQTPTERDMPPAETLPSLLEAPATRAVVSPLVTAEQARQISESIEALEENLLKDSDYTWWAIWKDNGRTRRKGFDLRADAEELAVRKSGLLARTKKKTGYQILGTYLGISNDPPQEELQWCLAHAGRHPVYKMTVKVIAPNGRYAVGTAAVATCERLSDQDKLTWSREEHDPRAMAETRAYIRAMQTLIGFGEREPMPMSRTDRGQAPSQSRSQPRSTSPKAKANADPWSAFWARAREQGLDQVEVHSLFRVSTAPGSLKTYAEARAQREQKPLTIVVGEMADELLGHPSSKAQKESESFQQRLEEAGPTQEPHGEEEALE